MLRLSGLIYVFMVIWCLVTTSLFHYYKWRNIFDRYDDERIARYIAHLLKPKKYKSVTMAIVIALVPIYNLVITFQYFFNWDEYQESIMEECDIIAEDFYNVQKILDEGYEAISDKLGISVGAVKRKIKDGEITVEFDEKHQKLLWKINE